VPPQDCSDTHAKQSDDFALDLRDQLEEIHTLSRHKFIANDIMTWQQKVGNSNLVTQFECMTPPENLVFVQNCLQIGKIDDLVYLVKGSAHNPVKSIYIDRQTAYKCTNLPSWLICQRKELKSSQ